LHPQLKSCKLWIEKLVENLTHNSTAFNLSTFPRDSTMDTSAVHPSNLTENPTAQNDSSAEQLWDTVATYDFIYINSRTRRGAEQEDTGQALTIEEIWPPIPNSEPIYQAALLFWQLKAMYTCTSPDNERSFINFQFQHLIDETKGDDRFVYGERGSRWHGENMAFECTAEKDDNGFPFLHFWEVEGAIANCGFGKRRVLSARDDDHADGEPTILSSTERRDLPWQILEDGESGVR